MNIKPLPFKLIIMFLAMVMIIGCGGNKSDDDVSSSSENTQSSVSMQAASTDIVQGEGTCYIIGELVDDCPLKSPHQYQSPVEQEGVYWKYHSYEGAAPNNWYESVVVEE